MDQKLIDLLMSKKPQLVPVDEFISIATKDIELTDRMKIMVLRMIDEFIKYSPGSNIPDEIYEKFIMVNPFISHIYDNVVSTERKNIKNIRDALLVNNWTEWRYDEFLNLPWWRSKTKDEQKYLDQFFAVVLEDAPPPEEIKARVNIYFDQLLSERGVRCTKALRAKFHQES